LRDRQRPDLALLRVAGRGLRGSRGGATCRRGADDDAVVRHSEEVMDLSRRLGGDPYAEAFARIGLGLVATKRGEYRGAAEHLQEAPRLFHDAGDEGAAGERAAVIGHRCSRALLCTAA
jgi:hypothetical protein